MARRRFCCVSKSTTKMLPQSIRLPQSSSPSSWSDCPQLPRAICEQHRHEHNEWLPQIPLQQARNPLKPMWMQHRRGSSSACMLLQAYDSGQGDRKVVRFRGLPLAGLARVSHRVCEAHAESGKKSPKDAGLSYFDSRKNARIRIKLPSQCVRILC